MLKSSSPKPPPGGGTHLLNQRDWVVMKWEDESRFSSYCNTLKSYVPVTFDLILVTYMILDRCIYLNINTRHQPHLSEHFHHRSQYAPVQMTSFCVQIALLFQEFGPQYLRE